MKPKSTSFSVVLFYFSFFFLDIVFSELVVRFHSLGFESGIPIFMILFALSTALLLAAACSAFGMRGRRIFSFVLTAILLLIFAVQLVYYSFCNSFMSVTQVAMGGDALSRFGEAAKLEILEAAGGLIWLLLPLLALILMTIRGLPQGKRTSWRAILVELVLFLALHFGTVLCLPLGGTQIYSPYDIYQDTFVLSMSARNFGILTTLRLELRNMLFSTDSGNIIFIPEESTDVTGPDHPDLDITDDIDREPVMEYDYNITDVDFTALTEAEENADVKMLHEYFAAQSGTKQNEYTGMFEGYNLILICAESFSPYVIDAERTPTLYKMATEGFIFTDYYNTVCDNTSNGEYALLTGLIPDTSLLGKGWKTFYSYNSFTASQENYLPFCLGNQFQGLGASTYAIHNYYNTYYGRNKTHPNLGYTFKAMYQGLKVVDDWPTSDVSMMEQTLPELLTPNENGEVQPFHAYFLTFSGHMPYTFGYNTMADKNKSVTDGLSYSSKVKVYIAAQQELEYALQYMMEQLEAAGVLDNTLIVLTNDHYPYPLGLDYLCELADKELDAEFDQYRSGLFIWSASMQKPITVDVPCCSLDVLPTLSNLLGLKYDSRLLMGTDIFSTGDHIAILADRSFVTDKVFYNCISGEVTLRDGVEDLPDGYLDKYTALVKNKFTLSTKMLYTDYYRKVYGE